MTQQPRLIHQAELIDAPAVPLRKRPAAHQGAPAQIYGWCPVCQESICVSITTTSRDKGATMAIHVLNPHRHAVRVTSPVAWERLGNSVPPVMMI